MRYRFVFGNAKKAVRAANERECARITAFSSFVLIRVHSWPMVFSRLVAAFGKTGMKMKSVCVSFVVPESGNLLVTSGVITLGTVRPGALGGQ
jgi:hypothetical protein